MYLIKIQNLSSSQVVFYSYGCACEQGKVFMVSGQHNEDCIESTVNTELDPIQEEGTSVLGQGDVEYTQRKTFDKEATTRLMRGKWRKMFLSAANPS